MSIDYSQFENDDFELESGFGEGELDSGGGVNKPGKYHVEIIDAQRVVDDGKVPQHKIDMKIVAGTDKSQVGKVIYHRINLAKAVREDGAIVGLEPLSPGSRKGIFKFFRGFGLLTDAEIEGHEKVKLPFNRLPGAQAIVEIANEPYQDERTGLTKDSYKIPWGSAVWRLDDEAVKDVPKDPESLAILASGAGVGDISDI